MLPDKHTVYAIMYNQVKGFPGGVSGKEPIPQFRRCKSVGSIPGLGRSSGEGQGSTLQ